jgi:hypothetical protein
MLYSQMSDGRKGCIICVAKCKTKMWYSSLKVIQNFKAATYSMKPSLVSFEHRWKTHEASPTRWLSPTVFPSQEWQHHIPNFPPSSSHLVPPTSRISHFNISQTCPHFFIHLSTSLRHAVITPHLEDCLCLPPLTPHKGSRRIQLNEHLAIVPYSCPTHPTVLVMLPPRHLLLWG